MSFDYEWKREDLKKILTKERYKSNTFYLLMAIALYVFVTWNAITSKAFDNTKLLIYGLIYLVIVMTILFFLTKIYVHYSLKKNDKNTENAYGTYHVTLDDKMIKVSINKQTISYRYEDINKRKKRRNYYFINTKDDKIGLTFQRSVLKDNYDQLVNYIDSKIK